MIFLLIIFGKFQTVNQVILILTIIFDLSKANTHSKYKRTIKQYML